ncbi:MAG: hypothetical protein SF187_04890 [Deltaproteobacteria bacterium]|nr:hypothetical protein [Deltaproteobacteria bacterium]
MNFMHPALPRAVLGVLLTLAGACGTGRVAESASPRPASQSRSKDTVPERLSALPGADKESDPENQERRFGLGAAKAKREEEAERKAAQAKRANLVGKP